MQVSFPFGIEESIDTDIIFGIDDTFSADLRIGTSLALVPTGSAMPLSVLRVLIAPLY